MKSTDSVSIDPKGWVCISRCHMHLFHIEVGDMFEFGIDLDEDSRRMRQLYFVKINKSDPCKMEEQSTLLKLRRYKAISRGFYMGPLLKLINVKPPFVCDIELGDGGGYNFKLVFPEAKSFVLGDKLASKLVEYKPV